MRFDLGTLDKGERSLPFGLLVFKVNPSMKSVFMTHTFVDLDFNLSSVCGLTVMLLLFPFSHDRLTLSKN